MLYRSCAISLFMLFTILNRTAFGQTCTPGGQYTVTTSTQLSNALACYANDCAGSCLTCSSNCPTEIIIPTGTNINVTTTTVISSAHNGLTLTINGSLTWTGTTSNLIIDVDGATDVTIRGSGLISTMLTPNGTDPISTAISIDGCTNVTVEGLTIRKVNDMVSVDHFASNGVTLRNLTGENLKGYGVWVGAIDSFVQNVTITDCSVDGSINLHGFRVYADNVAITNCEAYNVGSYGFWVVEGSNVVIDGFISNKNVRIGPNYATQDQGERLRCVQVRNISTSYATTGNVSMEVSLGTLGCFLENITAPGLLAVHSRPSGYVDRPTDRIHWRNLSVDDVSVSANSLLCPDHGPCLGDINNDYLVDVDDLLAVVNNWGACLPPVPSSDECYQCLADIVPYHCGNGNVNVDDLLELINGWGCTYTTPGSEDNAPRSLIECRDSCTEKVGSYGTPEWWECYESCVDGLCRAGIIICD